MLVTVFAPSTSTYVPSAAESSSAINILYMVTRHVPAVPFCPLSLALPPLMSAVKVANGVDSPFEIMVLNSVMKAFVPSCTSNTSVDDTSFVVVLLIEIKYLAALLSAIAQLSSVAAAESRSATSFVCASPDPACVPEESLSPSPILKNDTALSVDTEESANRPARAVNLTLLTALLTSEASSGAASDVDDLTICDEPENESKVEPSSVPCASMCFCTWNSIELPSALFLLNTRYHALSYLVWANSSITIGSACSCS